MKKILVSLLVFTLIFSGISVVAFAEDTLSPTAAPQYKVTASSSNSNAGKVEKIENEDGTITLKVTVADSAKFAKWNITGEYEIVSGSLTDTEITIKPLSDVTADATFAEAGTTTADSGKDNDSDKSPETGNAPVAATAVVLFTALGAAYVAKKQLSK